MVDDGPGGESSRLMAPEKVQPSPLETLARWELNRNLRSYRVAKETTDRHGFYGPIVIRRKELISQYPWLEKVPSSLPSDIATVATVFDGGLVTYKVDEMKLIVGQGNQTSRVYVGSGSDGVRRAVKIYNKFNVNEDDTVRVISVDINDHIVPTLLVENDPESRDVVPKSQIGEVRDANGEIVGCATVLEAIEKPQYESSYEFMKRGISTKDGDNTFNDDNFVIVLEGLAILARASLGMGIWHGDDIKDDVYVNPETCRVVRLDYNRYAYIRLTFDLAERLRQEIPSYLGFIHTDPSNHLVPSYRMMLRNPAVNTLYQNILNSSYATPQEVLDDITQMKQTGVVERRYLTDEEGHPTRKPETALTLASDSRISELTDFSGKGLAHFYGRFREVFEYVYAENSTSSGIRKEFELGYIEFRNKFLSIIPTDIEDSEFWYREVLDKFNEYYCLRFLAERVGGNENLDAEDLSILKSKIDDSRVFVEGGLRYCYEKLGLDPTILDEKGFQVSVQDEPSGIQVEEQIGLDKFPDPNDVMAVARFVLERVNAVKQSDPDDEESIRTHVDGIIAFIRSVIDRKLEVQILGFEPEELLKKLLEEFGPDESKG